MDQVRYWCVLSPLKSSVGGTINIKTENRPSINSFGQKVYRIMNTKDNSIKKVLKKIGNNTRSYSQPLPFTNYSELEEKELDDDSSDESIYLNEDGDFDPKLEAKFLSDQ